jgi:hypothetical protein
MNVARVLFGSVLIALGVVLVLGAADVVDSGEVIATWWPTVLVAAGVLQFATNPRHWLGPLVVTGIGVVLLLDTTDAVTEDTWPVAWAVLLVIAGIAVLSGALVSRSAPRSDDRIHAFAAFGGREVASHSDHFEGGSLGAIFGGTELDLRDARLAPDASIEVFTAFGGTEIRVPHGWRVITHGLPVFGGFENVTAKETDLGPDAPTLDVSATVLFGGLEVKH